MAATDDTASAGADTAAATEDKASAIANEPAAGDATGHSATPPAAAESAISEEEVSALLENNASGAVRAYDFTPHRINRTQLPMLEILCKSFAERMSVSLSSLLSRDATVHFTALDSAKAGELQVTLPVPASLAMVRLRPLPGFAFITVAPALLLTLLDGFFGGSGRATSDTQAAIAPAAQRFLALLIRQFAPDLTAAWAPVTPVELEFVKQEINPRLMQLGAAQESMLVIKFTVEFGAHSGRLDLMLPDAMLAPIREALAADGSAVAARKHEAWAPSLGTALQDAELETRAILAQAQISLRELVRLSPGDVIPIAAPQHVTLFAGETPLYRGRFGVSQGHNALKIVAGDPS